MDMAERADTGELILFAFNPVSLSTSNIYAASVGKWVAVSESRRHRGQSRGSPGVCHLKSAPGVETRRRINGELLAYRSAASPR